MSQAERLEAQGFQVIKGGELSTEETGAWVDAIKKVQGVVEYDLDGFIQEANDRFLKTAGFAVDEIRGKHHRIFCDSKTADSPEYQEFWKRIAKGEPVHGEYKRVGKNGREFWVVSSFCPIVDSDGAVRKVVEISSDVTESRAEMKVLTDIVNTTSLISETNLRGEIIYTNQKFKDVAKYTDDELMGKPHNIVRHPDMPKAVFKELWATIGRGEIFRGQVKNRAKDGSAYYVDAVIAPVIGSNGKPRKYIGIRYDLTELEYERQRMKALFTAVDTSFAYIEFELDGKVISYNKNFQDVMEYPEGDAVGQYHKIFCESSEVAQPSYQKFWQDLKNGLPQTGVFKRKTKSGKLVYFQAVYSPVKNEVGVVSKVIKIAIDITQEQKVLADAHDAANTLASASEELTAIASEMSSSAASTMKESHEATALAQQIAAGVQVVATNMEEMAASIKEIGRSTNESAQMAKTTLSEAKRSNEIIHKLGESSQGIGEVIKAISSIAQQTNLLALNAQIEAARAGEVGKGFSVVANEVKELAKQTARATDDITNKISLIQNDTKEAVSAIGGISKAIESLNGLSSVVAAAVEQQSATTNEISRVVIESKKGVDDIVGAIKSVSQTAETTNTSSAQTADAAKGLSKLAGQLLDLSRRNQV